MLLEHRRRRRRRRRPRATSPSQAFSSSTSPYAATRGSAFDTRVPSKSAGLAGVAGLGVDFHRSRLYRSFTTGVDALECPQGSTRRRDVASSSVRRPAAAAARQRFRRRLLDWYRAQRPRPAVAATPATRTTSSSPRSCCSRRRSIACCRSTTSGSTKYPTLEALADAPEDDVAETWWPLGYNIRPRRLHAIARESVDALRRRAAVGRGDAALVQGHRRLHGRRGDAASRSASARRSSTPTSRACCSASSSAAATPKAHAMTRHLWDVSRTVLPHRHVFDFNQALMDFGATLCTARKPKCLICPMRTGCAAYPVQSRQRASAMTGRRSSSPPRSSSATARYLVTRRLRGTHLEGLWEFPGGKCEPGETLADVPARASCARSSACDVAVGDESCSP